MCVRILSGARALDPVFVHPQEKEQNLRNKGLTTVPCHVATKLQVLTQILSCCQHVPSRP